MKYNVYMGEFSSWDDVKEEFQIDLPEPDIVFAMYEVPGLDE